MTKEQAIAEVRAQCLAGHVEWYNVYWMLEQWLSAAQISELLREWEQVRLLAQELNVDIGQVAHAVVGSN